MCGACSTTRAAPRLSKIRRTECRNAHRRWTTRLNIRPSSTNARLSSHQHGEEFQDIDPFMSQNSISILSPHLNCQSVVDSVPRYSRVKLKSERRTLLRRNYRFHTTSSDDQITVIKIPDCIVCLFQLVLSTHKRGETYSSSLLHRTKILSPIINKIPPIREQRLHRCNFWQSLELNGNLEILSANSL